MTRAGQPAEIHDHALDNIRYIREAMERASSFTSIPGRGGVMIGVTALIAAAVAADATETRWLTIWLVEAAVAVVVAAWTMYFKGRRANVSFTSAPAKRFFVSYSAPLVAAALLTSALAPSGRITVLPAVWLLLYGASFVSSGAFSIRVVPIMGVCFMFLGALACFVPFATGNILMAAGFGGLHIIFGYIIARNYGG